MQKLNTRAKIILLTSIIILIITASFSIVTLLEIRKNGIKEITEFKEQRLEQEKNELMNYVNMVYFVVENQNKNLSSKEAMAEQFGTRLKYIIDMAQAIIEDRLSDVRKGVLSKAQAQTIVLKELERLRYDDGVGYIWVNNTGHPVPRMIMHPIAPSLNNERLDDPKYNVADGTNKNIFTAFAEACQDKGEGFVTYIWPKPSPDGLTSEQPKLSYVRLIKEWDWIIGTGIYIDDAMEIKKKELMATIKDMRYDEGIGYFWLNDQGSPYPKMIMHPTVPDLDGKILDNPKYNVVKDSNQNLFQAVVEVTNTNGEGFVEYMWPKPDKDGLSHDQPKLSYVKLFEPFGWIIGTGVYIDDINAAVEEKKQTVNARIKEQIISLAIPFFITIIIAVILSMLLSSSISKPILRMNTLLKDLSEGEGDLSARMNIKGNDEFAQMAHYHDSFMEKLTGLVARMKEVSLQEAQVGDNLNQQVIISTEKNMEIKNNAKNLNTYVEELNQIINSSYTSLDDMRKRIQSLPERLNSQALSIERTSSDIEEVTSSLQNVKDISFERKAGADEMLKMTIEGGEKVKRTAQVIQSISSNTDKMQELIQMVQAVASQTNLLAMNAAIEAAHAGDAGKGFAVVSDEIRKLAENTAENATEINTSLKDILSLIENAMEASTESGNTFETIQQEVSQVHNSFEEITKSVSTLSSTSNNMKDSIFKLKSSSQTTQEDSIALSNEVGKIHDFLIHTKKFSENTESLLKNLESSIGQSSDSLDKLKEINDMNKESTEILKRQIGKFKT
ncbi:MAG: cache domain-containing protein [Spirochaetales bacterium]|nr:cache domain-containing protein [Spirochaetales bacterium]